MEALFYLSVVLLTLIIFCVLTDNSTSSDIQGCVCFNYCLTIKNKKNEERKA